MVLCSNCGCENEDNAKFCVSCGYNIQTLTESSTHMDFNPDNATTQQTVNNSDIDSQDNMNDYNSQQDYNNQPINYQQTTYQQSYRPHKSEWIAVLLDIIGGLFIYLLCGIGQIYLGLVKRGIVLGICGIAVTIINVVLIEVLGDIGSIVSLVLGIALVVYSAYDASLCTKAINNGSPIPLLFGSIELE